MARFARLEVLNTMVDQGVVPVFYNPDLEVSKKVAKACLDGGLKVVAENGWVAARPSGTENIYNIYAESFRGADHLRRIMEEAQTIVGDVLAAYPQQPGILSEPKLKEKS